MTLSKLTECSSETDSFFQIVLKTNKNRVIDRSLLTRKQHLRLLSIPNPTPKQPPLPRKKIKRCHIPQICPERIDQLSIPKSVYVLDVLQKYNQTLEPNRIVRLVKLIHSEKENEKPRCLKKRKTKKKKHKKKQTVEDCIRIWLKMRIELTTKLIMKRLKEQNEDKITPNYRQLLIALGLMKSLKIKKKNITMRYTKKYLMDICEKIAIEVDNECKPYSLQIEPIEIKEIKEEEGVEDEKKHVVYVMSNPPSDESEIEAESEEEGVREVKEVEEEEEEEEEESIYKMTGEEFEEEVQKLITGVIIEEKEGEIHEEGFEEEEEGETIPQIQEEGEQDEGKEDQEGQEGQEGLEGQEDQEDQENQEGQEDQEGQEGQEAQEGQEIQEGEEPTPQEGEEAPIIEEGEHEELEGDQEPIEGGEMVEGSILDEEEILIPSEFEMGEEYGDLELLSIEESLHLLEEEVILEPTKPTEPITTEKEPEITPKPEPPTLEILPTHPPNTISYLSWKIYSSWLEEFGNNINTYGKCLRNFRDILESKNILYNDREKIETILTNWSTYLSDSLRFETDITATFKGKPITKCPKCGDFTLYDFPIDHELPEELERAAQSTAKWRKLLVEAERLCRSFMADDVSILSHETIEIVDTSESIKSSEISEYSFEFTKADDFVIEEEVDVGKSKSKIGKGGKGGKGGKDAKANKGKGKGKK